MKALLFFILIIVIFVVIKFTLKRINQFRAEQLKSEQDSQQSNQQKQPQKMVSCHQCGVHLPKSEALPVPSKEQEQNNALQYACCEAHL